MTQAAILTISDSRNLVNDRSGDLISDLLTKHHVTVTDRRVVKDDIVDIQTAFLELEQSGPDIIITTGGTGVARRDVTIPAVRPLLQRIIPGFGEMFRQISFHEIGTRALASQALAGFNYRWQLTYCLPGSLNACKTALSQLIIPEYQHLLYEISNQRKDDHNHAH